jgi:hypothetical protein
MTTVQKILRMVTRSNEAEPQSETESDEVTEIFEKYNSLGDQLSIVRCQAFIRQYLAMTKKQKYCISFQTFSLITQDKRASKHILK